ncbi:hypothetical protein LIER_04073 [Lithospermum erythrorhizon]|uniref:Uncharacterized protein n=1 Tax=Lithospermum erythrorhizon TaxID=34254 RepID=A0AAV3NY68_LITER
MGRKSTLSATKVQVTSKKTKKDALTTAVQEVAFSVKQYFERKKKNEDNRPSAKVIHEVVLSVGRLTRNEVFKATQRLMNGNVQEFELIQDLHDVEKEEWIRFLLDN